jgi:N-carbamoyl-L-amino-acid hydrolase
MKHAMSRSVNAARLVASIEELALIGAESDGIHRTAFTTADRAARELVSRWMQEAQLEVRVDAAGNVIGRREGRVGAKGALATGSHIDTVPGAGRFDGAYGVLAGIETARTLAECDVALAHSLEVVAFADEEGGRFPGGLFGSRAMAGTLSRDLVEAVCAADSALDADMRTVGGDLARLESARRAAGEIAAYVELHVEQGPILARSGVAIGVVTGVTGRYVYDVAIEGEANHAGTTPMERRRDALVAASKFALAVQALAAREGVCRTATVGTLSIAPGAINVVPGRATLGVEVRDIDMKRLDQAETRLRERASEIAEATRTHIQVTRRTSVTSAPADAHMQETIHAAARALRLTTTRIPSGAGHDAQAMATLAPMGMIFVPSAEGKSHTADEYTTPEDCTNGANVLLATLLALDAAQA